MKRFLISLILLLSVAIAYGNPPDSIDIKKIDIEEVRVLSRTSNRAIITTQHQIEGVPSVMGERDVIKYLASTPGVISTSVLDPNIYVRGGAGHENRYYVNGFPVASPQHLTGIISLFDPYILKSSTLYKSGYPAEYSGVLSSFLNMRPSQQRDSLLSGEVSLGLVNSSLRLSTPVGRDDGVLSVSLRTSYLETMMRLIQHTSNLVKVIPYTFSDATASYSQHIGNKWSISLFGLYSYDDLSLEDNVTFNWNSYSLNGVAKRIDDRSTLTLSAGVWGGTRAGEFNIFLNAPLQLSNHSLRTQALYEYAAWDGGSLSASLSAESTLYKYGAIGDPKRLNIFNGSIATRHNTQWDSTIEGGVNIEHYNTEQISTLLLPRLRFSYSPRSGNSVWIDYARTAQYTSQITTLSVPSPADVTLPLRLGESPTQCDQISIGAEHYLREWISIYGALFTRKYHNAKDIAGLSLSQSMSSVNTINLAVGRGAASGFEAETRIAYKAISARVNYTYTNSWREIEKINRAKRYHPPYDITHNITATLGIDLSKRFNISAMWQYSSGVYITFPVGVGVGENIITGSNMVFPIYEDMYNFRLPSTHRLDLSCEYTIGRWGLNAGVYNAYNQPNISYINYTIKKSDAYSSYIQPEGLTLLPVIPHISLIYKW